MRLLRLLFRTAHAVAVVLFITGWILRAHHKLHSGGECQMTYSMREFLPVETINNTTLLFPNYRLYKFVDRRDPRYQHLLPQSRDNTHQIPPLSRTQHCLAKHHPTVQPKDIPLHIALYIPGHWGSYEQARSLGAHGVQLTRQREDATRIRNQLWNGQMNSTSLSNFVYEVYALDFSEQGGALHGQFLQSQSDFLARIVSQLSQDCQTKSTITLVAHSMGGYVAQLALQDYPHLRKHVTGIITLATPHANPLYALDPSIARLHEQLHNEGHEMPVRVISISGGIRDEMIDPFAARSSNSHHSLQASSQLFKNRPTSLGMDHRAIVWCHEVLSNVRSMIWKLVNNEDPHQDHAQQDYEQETRRLYDAWQQQYGYLSVAAMESSMLYNLPILFGMYVILAASRLHGNYYEGMVVLWVAGVAFQRTTLQYGASALLLGFVANAVNNLLLSILPVGVYRDNINPRRRQLGMALMSATALVAVFCAVIFLLWKDDFTARGMFQCFLLTTTIVNLYVVLGWDVATMDGNHNSSHCQLVLLAMVVLVAAMVGPLMLMKWERSVGWSTFQTILSLIMPVSALSMANILKVPLPPNQNLLQAVLWVAALLLLSPWILSRGAAYRAVLVVQLLSGIDLLSMILWHGFDKRISGGNKKLK